jgi:hypothetical protein
VRTWRAEQSRHKLPTKGGIPIQRQCRRVGSEDARRAHGISAPVVDVPFAAAKGAVQHLARRGRYSTTPVRADAER